MDNVVQMPTRTDPVADEIRSHIEGMKNAECDWRDHAIALCACVAAAKARYPKTKDFGVWWDAQGFDLNHQTRAALVAMGQDLDRAREVLAVTERRSLELVYRSEFQVTSARKSQNAGKAKSKSEKLKPEDGITENNKVADIADTLLADLEDGVPFPSAEEIKTRFSCGIKTASNGLFTARYGLRIAKAAPAVVAGGAAPVADDLSADEKSKVERIVAREVKKKLDALQKGFQQAVQAEYKKLVAIAHANWKAKLDFADKYASDVRREKYPLTKKQFKELLFFTHPDRQEGTLKDRAAEIFSIVKDKQDSLVMPEPPVGGPEFPATPDDLAKMKKAKK